MFHQQSKVEARSVLLKMRMGYLLHITVYLNHTPVFSNVLERIRVCAGTSFAGELCW